jgi:hypothetical protein
MCISKYIGDYPDKWKHSVVVCIRVYSPDEAYFCSWHIQSCLAAVKGINSSMIEATKVHYF